MVNLIPISIKNKDRTVGNNSKFNASILQISGISKISIRDVQVPISMYPIANGINNSISITINTA